MNIPFPSNPEEYEEYVAALHLLADYADEIRDSEEEESEVEPPDDSHLDGDYHYDEPEDRYLDHMYEDRYEISEYGMDGCCGDF
jgi:hypothetical protein